MTTEDKDRKKLSLSRGGTLSLGKTIETSQVKQSFSHGRSKTVQVERRRKRLPIVNNDNKASDNAEELSLKGLTSKERAARTRALKEGLQQKDDTLETSGASQSSPLSEEETEIKLNNAVKAIIDAGYEVDNIYHNPYGDKIEVLSKPHLYGNGGEK